MRFKTFVPFALILGFPSPGYRGSSRRRAASPVLADRAPCNGQDGMMVTRRALGLDTGGLFANVCPNFLGPLATIDVTTAGDITLGLTGLIPGTDVNLDGAFASEAGPDGRASLDLTLGAHQVTFRP